MAHVRKTQEMIASIKVKVSEMKQAALQPIKVERLKTGTPAYKSFLALASAKFWSVAPHLKGELPAKWCDEPSRIDLAIVVKNGDGGPHREHFPLEKHADEDFLLPPNTGSYAPDCYLEYTELTGEALKFIDDGRAKKQQREVIEAKYDTIEAQLIAFMGQHKSLNTAIVEMPALELYIDPDFMERLRAPVEKKVKDAPAALTTTEELGIDTAALSAMAISHRIISSAA